MCDVPCPLCPLVPSCEAGTTSVSGTVVTGAMVGADPVYRALVYVPNIALGAKLPPLVDGPSCEALCRSKTGDEVVASAVAGPDGSFMLTGVPAGRGIPLVVELGSWRYETMIDVQPCVDNPLPLGTARLPRKQSEGNIPLTAIATGDVDALECILRKMGIDDSEFTNPSGPGRIHFYRSNGAGIDATTPPQADLTGGTSGVGSWNRYDQILFPCEGTESDQTMNELTRFVDYTYQGGRVLTTHFSYTWLYQNAGFATAGQWTVGQPIPPSPLIADIDTTAGGGPNFAKWLELVGALSNLMPPQVSINDPRRNLDAVPARGGGERWIYVPQNVQVMTMFTPIRATPEEACGRVTYADFHVADAMNSALLFPAECPSSVLSPQEKILEFMILDLNSCAPSLRPPPTMPPPPPPPPLPPADCLP